MKFIETEHQASSAIGNCLRGVCDDGDSFTRWKILHVRIQLRTLLYINHETQQRKPFAAQVATNKCIAVTVDDPSAQVYVISNRSTRGIKLIDAA